MIDVELIIAGADAQLGRLEGRLANSAPLFRIIAGILESETEANFAAQGRPAWLPLKKSTLRRRQKRGSVLMILQDSGRLAASVSSTYGDDYAKVGAGGAARAYAAVHQFGGTIERPPYSGVARLRTTSSGALMRQGATGRSRNLAVFARDSHKRATDRRYTVNGFTISIPARPYLPFRGTAQNATLQDDVRPSVLQAVDNFLGDFAD
ncbi:MAG: phage virion morphogenesis protein [Bordetella sp. SCN 67-23]|nr:phage virion morphogenesis protein [Burkholderiales bacterium]ODS75914.1 MAG: phage virion morphogenesis protein [Bordetella sp. SCN 67-23]ODU68826.1 MAG: phage virion morphogenesis protein [Bordetella sp. SCN 68-11]OJW91790.1 MAG: phage virion morphogenesis protein [Burkholderiales bacterium 67-32]